MPDAKPDYDLASLFHRAARAVRQQTRLALSPHEITPHQARALMLLAHAGQGSAQPMAGLRNSQLAEKLRIAPRSATEVVDLLAEKDLVTRANDPSDRRAWLITLTDAGVELSAVLREDRRVQMNDFFSRLDGQDQDQLARILTKLLAEDC